MSSTTGEKLELILDAAYDLFGSNGFYETKISDIAHQAGIAKGTVYLYFKSKEELFMAVTRRDCEHFLDGLDTNLQNCSTMAERLLVIAKHHSMYYFERKHRTKLFFRTPNNDPELMAYMKQFMLRYMQAVEKVLTEGGVAQPVWCAESYIGMLDRIRMDILFNPEFPIEQLHERTDFVARLFLEGCHHSLNTQDQIDRDQSQEGESQ